MRLISAPDPGELERNENLRSMIRLLEEAGGQLPARLIRKQAKNADYWLRRLQLKEIIRVEDVEEVRESHYSQHILPMPPLHLSRDQEEVMEAVAPYLQRPAFQPFLLFGVTGSGKTEIYLHLVEKALRQGKGAMVLVPENRSEHPDGSALPTTFWDSVGCVAQRTSPGGPL